MSGRMARQWTLKLAAVAALLVVAGAIPATLVQAQGWWPWSSAPREPRPVPREPVYRGPATQPPPSVIAPGVAPPAAGRGAQSGICQQLEQRLAQEAQRGTGGREQLPKIENDLRNAQRAQRTAEINLERGDCYEHFLFQKTLRRSRQCIDISRQMDDATRQVADLNAQRQQILGTGERSFQDDIIRELARNGCGASYQQEASKRGGSNPFSSLWQEDDGGGRGGAGNNFGNLPFATYRTLCVRLCDGFYFPVSFSTLPNHFGRDADTCQSKCVAPVELFYHQNPGGAVEQMVSAKSQQPYTSMKSAFRYRKEYVQGCSCKQAEYVPAAGEGKRADAGIETPAAKQAATVRKP